MNRKSPQEVTRLLNEWRNGDAGSLERIVPDVYDELYRLARSYMRGQPAHHTLQATALVNEAFCRIGNIKSELQDRGHFIGFVAHVMRRILIDHARAKASQKRGGDAEIVPIDSVEVPADQTSADVLALEMALEKLEKQDARKVRIAELHYFYGATYAETAAALDISEATLHRELRMLKALLATKLSAEA